MRRLPGRGHLAIAEAVAAVLTLEVVEHLVIDVLTKGSAGDAASRAAQQRPHQQASQTADERTDGASGQANRCA
ncbi:hypothetical protein [Thauera sinica]|uniref:Uncharacterized protein n=1 Tax=Thauera sinica TaxID=2665146 RepID=A0ABW1AS86_9RHOO|nr:hypothetical protein [Thauera sp. K11]